MPSEALAYAADGFSGHNLTEWTPSGFTPPPWYSHMNTAFDGRTIVTVGPPLIRLDLKTAAPVDPGAIGTVTQVDFLVDYLSILITATQTDIRFRIYNPTTGVQLGNKITTLDADGTWKRSVTMSITGLSIDASEVSGGLGVRIVAEGNNWTLGAAAVYIDQCPVSALTYTPAVEPESEAIEGRSPITELLQASSVIARPSGPSAIVESITSRSAIAEPLGRSAIAEEIR